MPADVAKLLKRLEQQKTLRSTVEEVWKQCFSYTYPLRGIGFFTQDAVGGASLAKTLQAAMTDATGTDGTRILASALMSGLTPSSQRWPVLDVDGVSDGSKQWLDLAAYSLWENIHQSNYDAVAFDCMLDMAIAGQFALFCDKDRKRGGFVFEQWPLASTYCYSTQPGGLVDGVINEHQMSAEQMVADYGENMVSEKVLKAWSEKPDEMFTVVRAVHPREGATGNFARNLPVASIHFEKDSKKLLRESGYHEMPVGVPRWSVVPGTAYAFGPVFDALPDIKTLNKEVEYVLQNADMAIAGMWGAVDDGVLNAKGIKVGPRKVIVMNDKDSFFPLSPAGKFDVAALEIDRLQRSIRKVLMADQLTPQDGPAMTATEVSVRVELVRQQLGPVYGRLQSEFLQWLVTRTFGLSYRDGVFGEAPRELQGLPFSVQYNTPIARSQKAQDVAAMDRYEASLGMQAQAGMTDALDLYAWDAARRKRAELLGVPANLIPAQDDIEAKRDERAKQAQQAQAMQAMSGAVAQGAAA
jgi:hypothetical protein